MTARAARTSPARRVGVFVGSAQWVAGTTIQKIRALSAALNTHTLDTASLTDRVAAQVRGPTDFSSGELGASAVEDGGKTKEGERRLRHRQMAFHGKEEIGKRISLAVRGPGGAETESRLPRGRGVVGLCGGRSSRWSSR
ncbi:hypothetical protein Q5P01_025666 [Channa striata]|uniref:Uncharacterized protein n=1 Tax=Channa striata TaxID=64152 RepID=A0AA88INU7_CHASR|nr:hypothetical protein Q5P01_025666 [Channa striata]